MPVQRLSVVVPCYREAAGIEAFHRDLSAHLAALPDLAPRIVFVDDGSDDRTLEVLNAIAAGDPTARVYSLSRNFGHQAALAAGLSVTADADAVVVMDADGQHPPAVLARLVGAWRAGNDVVLAVRGRTARAGLLKRATSRGFYALFNLLSDTPIPPGAADFYLLSARARAALVAIPERRLFLRGLVSWIGFPRALVEYDAPARLAGVSNYTPRRMIGLALDAIFSFSATPVRLAARVGLGAAALGGVYLAYVVWRYFSRGDLVQGWGSLMSLVLILGGVQLMFIGLIGEYVARIFEETKGRPLFIFKQRPDEPRP